MSTERIKGNLPRRSILIIYDLERVGSTNTASSNEVIEQLSSSVSGVMEQQADPQVDGSEVGETSSEVEETEEPGNDVTEESDTDSAVTENRNDNPTEEPFNDESGTINEIVETVLDALSDVLDSILSTRV